MSTKYRLVALDLDGTTLNSRHELSQKTSTVLKNLSRKGLRIVIATGRSDVSVSKYLAQLELFQDTDVVCYNGAVCVTISALNQNRINRFAVAHPLESVQLILSLANKKNLVVQYYNGVTGDVYAVPSSDSHKELLLKYERLTGKAQVILSSYDDALKICLPAKMLVLTNDTDDLLATAKVELPDGLFHVIRGSPDPFFVEFLCPGASKGEGLKKLCEDIGVAMENVVAYGDGENDVEMLQLAGKGVAMANAKKLAKESADVVLQLSNDEDGVANHLEELDSTGMLEYI